MLMEMVKAFFKIFFFFFTALNKHNVYQNWNKSVEYDFTDNELYFGTIGNRKRSAPIHCPVILAQDLVGQREGFKE